MTFLQKFLDVTHTVLFGDEEAFQLLSRIDQSRSRHNSGLIDQHCIGHLRNSEAAPQDVYKRQSTRLRYPRSRIRVQTVGPVSTGAVRSTLESTFSCGRFTPRAPQKRLLQAPPARMTVAHLMLPRSVTTALTRPALNSNPRTAQWVSTLAPLLSLIHI